MPQHAPVEPLESNFGVERPFSLGVEEELILVGDDLRPLERAAEMVADAQPDDGEIVRELFTAMVESNSRVSSNAGEAVEKLVRGEMGGADSLAVPLDVSVGDGHTWDDAGH